MCPLASSLVGLGGCESVLEGRCQLSQVGKMKLVRRVERVSDVPEERDKDRVIDIRLLRTRTRGVGLR